MACFLEKLVFIDLLNTSIFLVQKLRFIYLLNINNFFFFFFEKLRFIDLLNISIFYKENGIYRFLKY
jgi:hypothetical protein